VYVDQNTVPPNGCWSDSSCYRDTCPRDRLARLISDEVSFTYPIDSYILDAHQGKGLGTWLIQRVDDTISSCPELTRALLVTSHGQGFYTERLGTNHWTRARMERWCSV